MRTGKRRVRLSETMDQTLKDQYNDDVQEIQDIAEESIGMDVTKPDMPAEKWMEDVEETKDIVQQSTGINVDKPDEVEQEYLRVEKQEQTLVDDMVGPGAVDVTDQNSKMSSAERQRIATTLVTLAEALVGEDDAEDDGEDE